MSQSNYDNEEARVRQRQREISRVRSTLSSSSAKPPPPCVRPSKTISLASLTGVSETLTYDSKPSSKYDLITRKTPADEVVEIHCPKRPPIRRAVVRKPNAPDLEMTETLRRESTKTRTTASTAAAAAAKTSSPLTKGSLSSLLRSNSDTAKYLAPNAPKLLQHYPSIKLNDYWKNMREWDFISDLNDRTSQPPIQKKHERDEDEQLKQAGKKETPLPDIFSSRREYCALWSPLLLREVRAQLLSDVVSDVGRWRNRDRCPQKVKLNILKGNDEDWINVRVVDLLEGDDNRGFTANDIVVLVRDQSTLFDAANGALSKQKHKKATGSSSEKHPPHRGLIGHVEYTRRSTGGLVVQVSRQLWINTGKEEMMLFKIGSNITSLREFTALCRMDQIPLLEYILCKKMTTTRKPPPLDATDSKEDDDDPSTREKQAKMETLAEIGGTMALGKGFEEYARHKFNLSQLEAIAASAREYGHGGFTLIKGPPGTGKTTTLCALLNALHIRQMNRYFGEVKVLAESHDAVVGKRAASSLSIAAKKRPRILVCAPSNAAVDNIILKIMEDGFIDGNGSRYNPSMVRAGSGQSVSVRDVCLDEKVEKYVSYADDVDNLNKIIEELKCDCRKIQFEITKLRQQMNSINKAAPYPLPKHWEIRIEEENIDSTPRAYFVNHRDKITTHEVPPPPGQGEKQFPARAMPEYKKFLSRVVKLVERYNGTTRKLELYSLCHTAASTKGNNSRAMHDFRIQVETHILDTVHIVLTTLGTAGNRALEAANKFEVVVIDEAAQSVEPSTLPGLQLGSSHAILVGDPQQLPATIFATSGRNTKYDRSLFQRLEEAGHAVHMLDTQYRMHPAISDFPRKIFYDGKLLDGPNVRHPEYGNPLKRAVYKTFHAFQPLTVFDLDSSEERDGTSLANSAEAELALHLFNNLKIGTRGLSTKSRVAIITPYAQQAALLRRTFGNGLGADYERFVEINTVDSFQGREANIVIFSCVRAAGSKGIGFLSDVRRMNVALTRAKYFLFVIARCSSIVVNPYWRDLVDHASKTEAVIKVPILGSRQFKLEFPDIWTLTPTTNVKVNMDTREKRAVELMGLPLSIPPLKKTRL